MFHSNESYKTSMHPLTIALDIMGCKSETY